MGVSKMEWRQRLVPVVLFIGLLLSTAWGLSQQARARRAELLLSAQYQRAYFDLLGHVENVSVLLAKSRVAASPAQTTMMLTDAWSQALTAQAYLNGLPLEPGAQRRTSTFLTQTGDFAQMVAARVGREQSLPREAEATLARLSEQARGLARELHAIAAAAQRGALRWGELQRLASGRLDDTPRHPVGEGMVRIEEDLMEYPTLLYDGPFSDHVTRRTPRTVPDEEVSPDEARERALAFLAQAIGHVDRGSLEMVGRVDGPVPAYRFEWVEGETAGAAASTAGAGRGNPGAGRGSRMGGGRAAQRTRTVRLDVAERGGDVIWMVDSRTPGRAEISSEEAVERAQAFATALGLGPTEPIFPLQVPGRVMVPLAPLRDGVVHYPDQVKVVVSLDDGRIVAYYAMDYLMNRGPRNDPAPEERLTEAEARGRLNPNLEEVREGRLAWILDEALREHFVYEFPATLEGEAYLVYIDAVTGDEVRIEKLLPTEEGTLVM